MLAAVRKARAVLRVPDESELAVELFLVDMRSGWLANRKMEPCLKKPEQELVYKSAQSQLLGIDPEDPDCEGFRRMCNVM